MLNVDYNGWTNLKIPFLTNVSAWQGMSENYYVRAGQGMSWPGREARVARRGSLISPGVAGRWAPGQRPPATLPTLGAAPQILRLSPAAVGGVWGPGVGRGPGPAPSTVGCAGSCAAWAV